MTAQVKRVPRQVIETHLLAALDDESKVAIIASQDDLNLLRAGLVALTWRSLSRPINDAQFRKRCNEMIEDLDELATAAFGMNREHAAGVETKPNAL